MKHLFLHLFPQICFEAPQEGAPAPAGSAEGGEGETAGGDSKSFFKAPEGGEGETPGEKTGDQGGQGGDASPSDRPDWLPEKYKTPEDFRQGYDEMSRKFHTKNEVLRSEIGKELLEGDLGKNYGELVGVPEDPKEYEYPENWEAPGEEIDGALRDWAKKNNVGKEAFQQLVNDVWAKTQPDFDAEMQKLGENAEDRVERLNGWLGKNIDEKYFGALKGILTSAESIEFMEHIADQLSEGNFAPADDGGDGPEELTRDGIRKMQEDPRYMTDPDYQKKVRKAWERYTALPASKQK